MSICVQLYLSSSQIYLTGLHAPIIAGEVIPLALRVINCSPVSLNKLKLSSSLHHCTLLKDSKVFAFNAV